MPRPLVTIIGKGIKKLAGLRGGGSAFPGLFVEHIYPDFIPQTLSGLPLGVAVISGTNGKTTTTKMVVELLESQGLKVFTNRTGSNFTRGVAAALLGEIDVRGRLDADIAVLELDEAHAVQFVNKVKPEYCLLLNVMRDQLDRFGEVDHTAKLLEQVAQKTTKKVVLNREDRRIADISNSIIKNKVSFFGLDSSLLPLFPSDDNLHSFTKTKQTLSQKADVTLEKFTDHKATFSLGAKKVATTLDLKGIYNVYNAAGALALVRAILVSDIDEKSLIETLSHVTPAFGRGESLIVNGQPLELVLVKNPSGFRLGLKSFNPHGYATMIAINDNYADGRDMSWLWDVDYSSLARVGVDEVSGIRAYDMALRLQYDEVKSRDVDTDLPTAVTKFIRKYPNKPKRIYCTYTAMLAIRKQLSKITEVEVIR